MAKNEAPPIVFSLKIINNGDVEGDDTDGDGDDEDEDISVLLIVRLLKFKRTQRNHVVNNFLC